MGLAAAVFPYFIPLFGLRIHPHPFFECLAFLVAGRLFFYLKSRPGTPALPLDQGLWVLAGCIVGSLLGSKALAWAENGFSLTATLAGFDSGKTIVGGILGGWAAVECVKALLKIDLITGDLFVFPLIAGTALGRIGCFLTGLPDHTHGFPCSLPWCVDFGDGQPRHPTQLYEIAFVLLYGVILLARSRRPHPAGYLFRLYVFAYMLFRFCIEFIKPRHTILLSLSAIQIAALTGTLIACAAIKSRARQ